MDVIDSKTTEDLLKSLLAETAKARNEINCSQADLKKAQNRISFLLVVINKLIERQEIKG
jgi:hypothetical protein